MNAICINATLPPPPSPLQHVMTAKKYEYIQIVRCVITHVITLVRALTCRVARDPRHDCYQQHGRAHLTFGLACVRRLVMPHITRIVNPPSFGGGGGKSTIARDDVELKNRAWHLWLRCLDCVAHRKVFDCARVFVSSHFINERNYSSGWEVGGVNNLGICHN